MNSLYKGAYNYAKQGEGYIRSTSEITGGTNLMKCAWAAIELDSEVGKKWEKKFASLVPLFVKNGKASSAMWTANLAGDLATGTNGDADFDNATNTLRSAIEAGNSTPEIIKQASDIYFSIFEEDCKKALNRENAQYLKLVRSLRDSNIALKEYESKGLLP